MLAASATNGLRLFIHLPVFEFPRTFALYRLISLPHAIGNGTLSLRYKPLPESLAVATDHQTFRKLDRDETRKCVSAEKSICPISRAVSRKQSKQNCAVALFQQDTRRIQAECTRELSPWIGSDTVYLARRRWGFSSQQAQQIIITCPAKGKGTTSHTTTHRHF